MTVKEDIDETIENSVKCVIDRRIIKHVDLDQDQLMQSITKLIESLADSNQVILKADLLASKSKTGKLIIVKNFQVKQNPDPDHLM